MQPHVYVGRERPGLDIWWDDTIGQVVDLTDYSGFTVSIKQNGVDTPIPGASVTAHANPTLDTGSADDVPSLTVSFAAGAIDANVISPGPAVLRIVAMLVGRDRKWEQHILVGE